MICPDTCRRGSTSRTMGGPITCGSCGGLRADIHEEIDATRERYERGYEWENAWRFWYSDKPIVADEFAIASLMFRKGVGDG